ncbi:YbfB/YjiJ family MFS transporter [Anaeromyxobacter sp. PSR-1]|uniref:YbfB/YjiJ family MFS transporter n=1 Tax=Anaeromyxobacter sp. PSR-1 TaxID=1300915 RepID=UPI0007515403|nr:YbfB/YjiJ family MFS transporter [Anaeromyxobacter sp. PSR-1]
MGAATRRALAGALALAAAMGIGRFAYTALLPGVQHGLGFDDAVGGAIASANLVGYLAGVLWARRLAGSARRGAALRLGLAATAVLTAAVTAVGSEAGWAAVRFGSGVASGLVFVLASAAALEVAPGHLPRPGVLYGGVGVGIALAAVVAALAPPAGGWRVPWWVLGGAAAALAVPGWRDLSGPLAHDSGSGGAVAAGRGRAPVGFGRLATAYFLEGLGYIVSGTFAVAAVRRTPGLEALAPWTWALAGLAAAPSALLWASLGRRIGVRSALVTAHLVQAAGMALPSLSSAAWAALAGAALFGGTFIGITTLTVAAAREVRPRALGRAVGTLTAIYGVGQIVGPLAAGAVAQHLGDPRPAVLAAAAAVALGAVVLVVPSRSRVAPVPDQGR